MFQSSSYIDFLGTYYLKNVKDYKSRFNLFIITNLIFSLKYTILKLKIYYKNSNYLILDNKLNNFINLIYVFPQIPTKVFSLFYKSLRFVLLFYLHTVQNKKICVFYIITFIKFSIVSCIFWCFIHFESTIESLSVISE